MNAKKMIDAAQRNALLGKLKENKPLTGKELKFLYGQFPEELQKHVASDHEIDDGQECDIVDSANKLANRLGVARQTIAYHRGRTDAPHELSVSAWRKYLALFGKNPTYAKLTKPSAPTTVRLDYDTPFAVLFNHMSSQLPVAMGAALEKAGVKLGAHQTDLLVLDVWYILALSYQILAHKRDACGPFDPIGENGQCEIPEEIKKLAARISAEHESAETKEPETEITQQMPSDLPPSPTEVVS